MRPIDLGEGCLSSRIAIRARVKTSRRGRPAFGTDDRVAVSQRHTKRYLFCVPTVGRIRPNNGRRRYIRNIAPEFFRRGIAVNRAYRGDRRVIPACARITIKPKCRFWATHSSRGKPTPTFYIAHNTACRIRARFAAIDNIGAVPAT